MEAVQFGAAATGAIAQAVAEDTYSRNRQTEMHATATVFLRVTAAITVNSAVSSRDAVIGYFRLFIGDTPRTTSQSAMRPPMMLPTTPNRKGMDATQPVLAM